MNKPLYSAPSPWSGRHDGPGPAHARWHSVVQPDDGVSTGGVALLGFASDEGVRRNGGRPGAAAGPAALRSALGGLAIHDDKPRIDAGTVTTQGDDLAGAHEALSDSVEKLIRRDHLVVVLGGGHETAFGSHRGLYRGLDEKPAAIVNLDAHFDLRSADEATSGTPFRQIAELVGADFDYSVFGISRPNNTRVLFETAEALGTTIVTDEELIELSPAEAGTRAARTTTRRDAIHLSIDLDVLPAAVAPGVSAPAGLGVALEKVRAMALAVARTGRLRLVDVVELNPSFDVDSRTAKTAARLIDDIVAAHLSATRVYDV